MSGHGWLCWTFAHRPLSSQSLMKPFLTFILYKIGHKHAQMFDFIAHCNQFARDRQGPAGLLTMEPLMAYSSRFPNRGFHSSISKVPIKGDTMDMGSHSNITCGVIAPSGVMLSTTKQEAGVLCLPASLLHSCSLEGLLYINNMQSSNVYTCGPQCMRNQAHMHSSSSTTKKVPRVCLLLPIYTRQHLQFPRRVCALHKCCSTLSVCLRLQIALVSSLLYH